MSTIDDLAGTMLVCIMLTAVLYGVNTTQAFLYYQRHPNDSRSMKSMVALLWVLDTVHVGFCLDYIHKYAIEHFGDDAFMSEIDWIAGVTVILQLLIAALVHGYYVWRIWIVTGRRKHVTALVALLATIRCVFGLISAGLSYTYTRWSTFHHERLSLGTSAITLSSAVLADCLILASLVYFIGRSRLALDPYEGMVRIFTVYIANSGAITAIFSVASLIMFLVIPSGFIWLGLVELQSKLYVYAFFTGLNDRARAWDGSTRSSRISTFGFWRPTLPTAHMETGFDTRPAETQVDEEMALELRKPASSSEPRDSTTECTTSDPSRISK